MLPLPLFFGPGTFAMNSHSYNPLFKKILDPPLELHSLELFSAFVSHLDYISSWKCSCKLEISVDMQAKRDS